MSAWTEWKFVAESERAEIVKEMRLLWFYWAGCFVTAPAVVLVCHLFGGAVRAMLIVSRSTEAGFIFRRRYGLRQHFSVFRCLCSELHG